jgi:ribosomal protein S18 acetylase RimI-like enzyme
VRALSAHEGVARPHITGAHFRRHAFGRHALYRTLVAEADGVVVGMVAFNGSFSSQGGAVGLRIVDLIVAAHWRGRGIGRRLVAAVGHQARRRGGDWVAWMVRRDNRVARGFYRALGAKLDPDLTMYLRRRRLDRLLARAGPEP